MRRAGKVYCASGAEAVSRLARQMQPEIDVSCVNVNLEPSPCYHPFIPVIEMPSMKVFWVKKNNTTIGRAMIVLAAIR